MSEALAQLQTSLADRYAVERELGAGGMANVYLARDLRHDRHVALKVLRPELAAVLGAARFLAEIKITARLDHPHIVTLIDSGEADGFLYYVLPWIRGESLRERLNREKQLGLEEALTITRQVAGALEHAHRQGVVHRDIKPENILLHEGEAMLADFGIALAVKEAGGNRLTETGLSLGTPQYMSPEQATGDRSLDARSDVYSLGAVLYEMLAGEPPLTGPTVRAVIAKLLTERPTGLRVVRDTVPPAVDAAVAKALAKVPADRFGGAEEFARSLEEADAPAAAGGRRLAYGTAIGVVALLGLVVLGGGWAMLHRRPAPVAALGDRRQLTFSGNVLAPALSPDGKQLAYFTRSCAGANCTYALEVQDVGGTSTASILSGATAIYGLEWSPDRRNLISTMTIGGRWGTWLVSALGGTPRYLSSSAATFFAGGDSLLVGPAARPDTAFWVKATSLDGTPSDSIRVAGPGNLLAGLTVVPGTRWIVALVTQRGHGLWQVLDRRGRVADRVVNSCTCPGRASADALWLVRSGDGPTESVVRLAIDPGTGRLASRQDTVFNGTFTNISVTADGSSLALDEGTWDFGVWALELPDALHGRFPDARRLIRSSSPVSAAVSPDGASLLVGRAVSAASGRSETLYSVLPFGGGAETPLHVAGKAIGANWADPATIQVAAQTPRGLHIALLDARTGAERQALDLPDSNVVDMAPLPGGWAWIPGGGQSVEVRADGRSRSIPRPPWFAVVFNVSASPDGRSIAYTGWHAESYDTVRVDVVPAGGGPAERWFAGFGENGYGSFLADGSLVFPLWGTEEAVTLYHVRGPGRAESLGTIPRPVDALTVSKDLRRVTVHTREYRGDAWMSTVLRR